MASQIIGGLLVDDLRRYAIHPARVGYTAPMSIDRILISLGILLLIVSAVLAAVTWL